jgi:hypothetical protein
LCSFSSSLICMIKKLARVKNNGWMDGCEWLLWMDVNGCCGGWMDGCGGCCGCGGCGWMWRMDGWIETIFFPLGFNPHPWLAQCFFFKNYLLLTTH